jgi:hypothetical protein
MPAAPAPSSPATPSAFDPLDPALYRNSQSFADLTRTKRIITDCPVTPRLKKDWWIRIHPNLETYSMKAGLLLLSDEEPYLVPPPLVPAFKERRETALVTACLYLAQNRQGFLFLWAVRVPSEENPVVERWMKGPLEAAHRARTEWVRLTWNQNTKIHEVFVSEAEWPEPEWPEEDFRHWLTLGFKDRVFRSLEHPVLRELWGQK